MAKYVDTKELEGVWGSWLATSELAPNQHVEPLRDFFWEQLAWMIYLVCKGVSTHFNPKDAEEHEEHAHDATAGILEKIRSGKLTFTPGRAPVFNLLTTTAFHLLYSKMNRQNRTRKQMERYRERLATGYVQRNHTQSSNLLPVNEPEPMSSKPKASCAPHYKYASAFCQYLSRLKRIEAGLKKQTLQEIARYAETMGVSGIQAQLRRPPGLASMWLRNQVRRKLKQEKEACQSRLSAESTSS